MSSWSGGSSGGDDGSWTVVKSGKQVIRKKESKTTVPPADKRKKNPRKKEDKKDDSTPKKKEDKNIPPSEKPKPPTEQQQQCDRYSSVLTSTTTIALPQKKVAVEEKKKEQKTTAKPEPQKKAPPKQAEPEAEAVKVLLPRGMRNGTGTHCFMNAVLQALIGCPPLRTLIDSFAKQREKAGADRPPLPVTGAFVSLLSQVREGSFEDMEDAIDCPSLFNLTAFNETILPAFFRATGNDPENQQDAGEFYSFLVTSLQDEHAVRATTRTDSEEASGWTQVNGKKRSVVLNAKTDFDSGPVASVFLGYLTSSVRRKTSSVPSVTVQPFECLHLDITSSRVTSVESALDLFQSSESLSGGMRRTMSFAKLPKVLCLHLKRFIYTTDSVKVTKPIEFDTTLELKPDSGAIQRYHLVAVVRHSGDSTLHGHYTADVRYDDGTETGTWIRCNDSCVDFLDCEDDFFEFVSPYLLFYVAESSSRRKSKKTY